MINEHTIEIERERKKQTEENYAGRCLSSHYFSRH